MKLFRPEWLVFILAFIVLSWNLQNVGIASGYIDPLLHFGAQDEATYTREAITMARDGGWMTPTFLGRWVFEKPPLLMWLSALSMKTLGIGRFTARFPAVFAGALLCALCFSIVRSRSLLAGCAAAAMVLSSQILFIMSRHNMTDILLAAAGVCAFAIVLRDPALRRAGSFVAFAIAAAAGLTAKSLAGVLILAVMGVVVVVAGRSWTRASLAAVAALCLASPWFVYNFAMHREWFLADMGFQLITIGTTAQQTAQENHLWFYIVRILYSDAVPLILSLTAVPALVAAVRRREATALLAGSYVIIYFAALMVFHFHSEQYLCWFVPSLILMGAMYSPLLNGKGAAITLSIVSVAFVLGHVGVLPDSSAPVPSAPILSRYCAEHRATTLYILGVDDEFYSAVLPLHRVRYGWIDASGTVAREHPHLANLGILINASELPQLDAKLPIYLDRLRAWGLDSAKPIATGIAARSLEELTRILSDHPESDYLVSRAIIPEPGRIPSHRVAYTGADFTLLESKTPVAAEPPAWSCEM